MSEEAFAALEQSDEEGRKALSVACMMWEETWRDAVTRAEKAGRVEVPGPVRVAPSAGADEDAAHRL